MPNSHVHKRLAGIRAQLLAAHAASKHLTNETKGAEREAFISQFLANVLPPIYRFGTGDATDAAGNRSGQLDVVVEYPFSPTLPAVGGSHRLYLAESVAAVIEVKSTLPAQLNDALRTLRGIAPLRRTMGATMSFGSGPSATIPLFIAAYTGWKTIESVEEHVQANPGIAGILVIDNGFFVSSDQYLSLTATGDWALWGLICCLHRITNSLQSASTNPLDYAV